MALLFSKAWRRLEEMTQEIFLKLWRLLLAYKGRPCPDYCSAPCDYGTFGTRRDRERRGVPRGWIRLLPCTASRKSPECRSCPKEPPESSVSSTDRAFRDD